MSAEVLTADQLEFIGNVRNWVVDSAARILLCDAKPPAASDALDHMFIDYDGFGTSDDGQAVQPMIDAIVADPAGRQCLAAEIDAMVDLFDVSDIVDRLYNDATERMFDMLSKKGDN